MRKILLNNVRSGMRLARTIYSQDGRMLLVKGMVLKEEHIERLYTFSITEIYIDDDLSEGVEINDVIGENTRIEAKNLVRDIMERYHTTLQVDIEKVSRMVIQILDELLQNKEILVNLSDIRAVDDYTFGHSVNVCVLSLIIGIQLNIEYSKLRNLGIGALLHDIGKIFVSEEILKKPSKLTDNEFKQIQKHTTLGYEVLKKNPNINICSAYIALGHHERCDGSGYPFGIKGQNIHMFTRIVAVADVYDALTSNRVYRTKMKIHEVLEYMGSLAVEHFDRNIVQYFLANIPAFPVGAGVELSTGQKGIVIRINRQFLTRPVVRIIYNENGLRNQKFEEIDLTERLNIVITDTYEL